MSWLFVTLVALSAFFAAMGLFERAPRRAAVKPGRWSPRTRPSLRARLRRA